MTRKLKPIGHIRFNDDCPPEIQREILSSIRRTGLYTGTDEINETEAEISVIFRPVE